MKLFCLGPSDLSHIAWRKAPYPRPRQATAQARITASGSEASGDQRRMATTRRGASARARCA